MSTIYPLWTLMLCTKHEPTMSKIMPQEVKKSVREHFCHKHSIVVKF